MLARAPENRGTLQQETKENDMTHGTGMGFGMGFGWFFGLLTLVLVVLAIAALIKYLRK